VTPVFYSYFLSASALAAMSLGASAHGPGEPRDPRRAQDRRQAEARAV